MEPQMSVVTDSTERCGYALGERVAGRETVERPSLELAAQSVREEPPGFLVDVARDETVGERGNDRLLCGRGELCRRGGSLLPRLSIDRDRHATESAHRED